MTKTSATLSLEPTVGEYCFIDVDKLTPFQNQARKNFNNEEITKLANSIKTYGLRHPLTVIKTLDDKYEVVSGERRLRASKKSFIRVLNI